MTRRFRELTEEEKAAHSVTGDTGDESFVYCASCGRAMEQGDCIVPEDLDAKLQCAYDDCVLEGNIAAEATHGWEVYRQAFEEETADWPDEPIPGECYRPGQKES